MKATNLKIAQTLLFVDLFIVLLSTIFFNKEVLYSTQIAFFSSLLVTLSSLSSYRNMVQKSLQSGAILAESQRDMLDKIEDPYDLYSEEEKDQESDMEDKKVIKRRPLSSIFKDSRPSFSFYRMGSYILLVLGFLYLHRQHLLHIPSYLLTLMVPIVIIVYCLLSDKNTPTSENL